MDMSELRDDFLKREQERAKKRKAEKRLLANKTSKKEQALIDKKAKQIEKYYVYDLWKELFGQASFENEMYGQGLFHVLLGQLLARKKILQSGSNFIDWRIHLLFIQGSGCLEENTTVQTKDGVIKMKDLPEHFLVKSYSFDKKKVQYKPTIKINSGKKKLYKITLKDGREVMASEDHIFFNDDGEVRVKDMSVGMKIKVQSNNSKPNPKISKLASDRWKDKKWVKKEMEKRNKMSKNGDYIVRGIKSAITQTGKTYEQLFGRIRGKE